MKEPIGTGGSCSMATECSPPGRWSFERMSNSRLVRLEGAVNLPVKVRSWESPESHVAGSRCSWVTGGGEAEYPSEEEVQTGSPYHNGNPAASTCEPRKGTRESRASQPNTMPRQSR